MKAAGVVAQLLRRQVFLWLVARGAGGCVEEQSLVVHSSSRSGTDIRSREA